MVVIVLGSVLLITLILLFAFCIFKQRQTQRVHSRVLHRDENPMYGGYDDYYNTVEVVDRNDYYFSDYEVGSGRSTITDNNPDYEY